MRVSKTYNEIKRFKRRFPLTVAFRISSHSKIIEKHIDINEEIKYAFIGQKNNSCFEFPNTFAVVLTNKRMLLGKKRLLFGYLFYAVTPDLLNDVTVQAGILWGKVIIDTLKETIVMSNLSRNALPEVETAITEYMIKEGKKAVKNKDKE
jgi:hypothetical protein